ncbi:MAG: hypothetical protein G8345_22035 [Magnetococcales bacterium]|nr:hypothetical protein [Magnetococcales bacterium]
MQRTKGATGERELAGLLRDRLGLDIRRNLEQARSGGADLLGLPGLSLECKRAAVPKLGPWWEQTIQQAGERVPVLAFRVDRQPWRFLIPLGAILPGTEEQPNSLEFTATLSIEGFSLWFRERLASSAPSVIADSSLQ